MKKLLLLTFLLLPSFVKSQWLQQYSNIYDYYNTVFFIDSLNGWIGGYKYEGNSFVLKTTDEGKKWEETQIGGNPSSIYFINANLGFCASYNGIYKSTDGGNSWLINYNDTIHYSSIKFTDESHGWAAGDNTKNIYIISTDDGGINWTKSFIIPGVEPHLEIINDSTVFIISETSSKILKSIDGGNNWNIVFDDSVVSNTLWDISFSNELNGFACGVKSFLFTTDGGNIWIKKNIPLTFCENILSIDNQCWVSGFGIGYSSIIYTDDYGNTWTPIFVDDSTAINDFFFSDVNNGWYCSSKEPLSVPLYNGFIYKIKKGWTEDIISPSTPQQIYPKNDSFIKENFFNFEWEKLNYSLYRLQISYDSLFTNFFVITNHSTGDTIFIGNNLYVENDPLIGLSPDKKYYWRVRSENKAGISKWSETWSFTISSPDKVNEEHIPKEFKLFQNYPNPFNPTTTISFCLPSRSLVSLTIFDVLGRKAATIINSETLPAGNYSKQWNASDYSNGVYFYQLQAGTFTETKKLLLLR